MGKWNKKAKIRSALRQVWRWSPARTEALKAARVSRGLYLCNGCRQLYSPKAVQVDHNPPIGAFVDWNTFIERLFEGPLQVLCKEKCHKSKTKAERAK